MRDWLIGTKIIIKNEKTGEVLFEGTPCSIQINFSEEWNETPSRSPTFEISGRCDQHRGTSADKEELGKDPSDVHVCAWKLYDSGFSKYEYCDCGAKK